MSGPYDNKGWNEHIISPDCCEPSGCGAVFLSMPASYFYENDVDAVPRWVVRTHRYTQDVQHCPFCGTPVPEIEKCDPGGPVCVIADGGYCCLTCDERAQNCTCLPPEAGWRVKRPWMVAQLKPWTFQIDFDNGASFTVDRRDDDRKGRIFCLGPTRVCTTHEGPDYLTVLRAGLCDNSRYAAAIAAEIDRRLAEQPLSKRRNELPRPF